MTIPEELHYVLLNFLGSVLNSKVNVFILNLIKKLVNQYPSLYFSLQSIVITESWQDNATTVFLTRTVLISNAGKQF